MSNHLISFVYKRNAGSATRKAVLVLLADKASDDGHGIWASKQRMADELCMSKQSVINTIRSFIQEGLLREVGKRKCANGFTIEYAIDLETLATLPLVKWHDDQSTKLTGKPARPVNDVDPTSQPGGPDQSTTLTQTPVNPPEPQNDSAPEVALTPDMVVEDWNEMAREVNICPARKLDTTRRRKLNTLIKKHGFDEMREAFAVIRRTKWMHGENDRGWRANMKWFLRPETITSLIEGTYDDQKTAH